MVLLPLDEYYNSIQQSDEGNGTCLFRCSWFSFYRTNRENIFLENNPMILEFHYTAMWKCAISILVLVACFSVNI